jgi:hypothetical protein
MLQVLLLFVFVVAVAFGAWFFRYGLSLLGGNLEPQVPGVAPRDVPQEKGSQAARAEQIRGVGFDTGSR